MKKKNFSKIFISIIFGFAYAFPFYKLNMIVSVGDQKDFQLMAAQFHYHYFDFAIARYFTWSSRLLIESFTMFFSAKVG